MANHKRFFIVLDVEGSGEVKRREQLPYDFGIGVMNRAGDILETASFINEDVFCDCREMATAYYVNKMPEYLHRLFNRETEPQTSEEIICKLVDFMHRYHTNEIWAYNVNYDFQAIVNMIHKFRNGWSEYAQTAADWFLEYAEPCDIWGAAVSVLYNFQYCRFCQENGFVTEKGNIRTSAEIGYRYLSGEVDFEEEHRGVDDVRIECAILHRVLDTHKPYDSRPRAFLWREVKKKATHGNKGRPRKRKPTSRLK